LSLFGQERFSQIFESLDEVRAGEILRLEHLLIPDDKVDVYRDLGGGGPSLVGGTPCSAFKLLEQACKVLLLEVRLPYRHDVGEGGIRETEADGRRLSGRREGKALEAETL
jgi:hypothetical protein